MADFGTFDLARAYSAAEDVKGAQQASTLRGLQIEGAKLDLEKARQPKKLTFDEIMSNQQIAHAAFTAVANNPDSAPQWADTLKKAGIMSPEFDVASITPQQLQQYAAQAAQESGSVLAALDPKTYGPELSDTMKAFVEAGGDPRDKAALVAFKDAEQARKDKATLSGQAVTQRGQDITARGQDITARGQDITAETARLNRESTEKVNAAKATAPAAATGEERKNAVLATRLQNALTTLDAIEKKNPGASQPTYGEKALEAIGQETAANVLVRSEDRQRADAAQRDALDAALTLATGAAYTPVQFEAARISHFPQIGDKPEAIKEKQQRLTTLVAAARAAAARAAPAIDAALPAAPQAAQPTGATPPVSRLKEGVITTFANGQKWKLENGQPVKVQ